MALPSKAARTDVILSFIREECEACRIECSPEMPINKQPCFCGEDAEDLIYAAGAKIGLSRNELDRSFPYGTYFDSELYINSWLFRLIRWLFNRVPIYQPLTARGFAELLVDIQDAAAAPRPAEPAPVPARDA